MDPTQKSNPTFIPESSQTLTEENSRDDSGASQNFSETLIKNLSKLTLSASCTEFPSPLSERSLRQQSTGAVILGEIGDDWLYRRGGVRTLLLSVQRDRMARFRYMLLCRGSRQRERTLRNTGLKGVKNASRRGIFKYPCSFCVSSGWDPSENARIGNYDTRPLRP
ncbi:LOW QUALITY PROTEIN: developmental pluripotency-associated protein 3 [Cebus imitator]|uniref:LOW QUALITY PROTEIN: developmental pluripotency-associated protein 3 n=1 Tax=Cebus imitator TaxID=2715852 RepID=UPI00080A55EF|nr:LOW QUALITY PROTEIN: developmental pluripotency-associated protein 3 [Cebus imitator]